MSPKAFVAEKMHREKGRSTNPDLKKQCAFCFAAFFFKPGGIIENRYWRGRAWMTLAHSLDSGGQTLTNSLSFDFCNFHVFLQEKMRLILMSRRVLKRSRIGKITAWELYIGCSRWKGQRFLICLVLVSSLSEPQRYHNTCHWSYAPSLPLASSLNHSPASSLCCN